MFNNTLGKQKKKKEDLPLCEGRIVTTFGIKNTLINRLVKPVGCFTLHTDSLKSYKNYRFCIFLEY